MTITPAVPAARCFVSAATWKGPASLDGAPRRRGALRLTAPEEGPQDPDAVLQEIRRMRFEKARTG